MDEPAPCRLPQARVLRAVRIAAILLAGVPFAAGCSTVPGRQWPAFDLRAVRAEYAILGDAPVEVPVSNTDLTVLELAIAPPPVAERWDGGHRRVVPPPGCTRLVVTCRYRAYQRDGAIMTPQELFPGATVTDLSP